jgi:hypothetical protein
MLLLYRKSRRSPILLAAFRRKGAMDSPRRMHRSLGGMLGFRNASAAEQAA